VPLLARNPGDATGPDDQITSTSTERCRLDLHRLNYLTSDTNRTDVSDQDQDPNRGLDIE